MHATSAGSRALVRSCLRRTPRPILATVRRLHSATACKHPPVFFFHIACCLFLFSCSSFLIRFGTTLVIVILMLIVLFIIDADIVHVGVFVGLLARIIIAFVASSIVLFP